MPENDPSLKGAVENRASLPDKKLEPPHPTAFAIATCSCLESNALLPKDEDVSKGLLIHNPKAGRQDEGLLPQLVEALGGIDTASIEELSDPEAFRQRIQTAGYSWVAAAGGDGTLESVAAALIGTGLPLGVIAAGTYNNFARSLDLPLDPLEACAVIRAGQTRPIDVGYANGRPFFESLGSGLDAALYPLGEEIKSGQLGRLTDFFRRAYRFRRQRFTFILDRPACEALIRSSANESRHLIHALSRCEKPEITLSALMLSVSNGPYFGMNFAVAPEQTMDDGHLTVTVFSRYSKIQLWWHFLSIAFAKRAYSPKSIAFRVRSLRIDGPKKQPVHLDGTPQKGLWPLEIECRPGQLAVFAPAA